MQTIRRTTLFILPLVVLLSACLSQVEWKAFSSTKGRFAVSMPGAPTADHDVEDYGDAGKIGIFSYVLDLPSAQYAVIHADFPADFVQRMGTDQMLITAREEALAQFEGVLLDEKDITLTSKYPGREQRITVEGVITVRSRLYLVGQRIYYVMVAMPNRSFSAYDAQRFLDSFTLLKP
jgi:hypothetical protein